MPGRTRSQDVRITHRRQEIADLYLQGWAQTAIAKQVGVAQSTVSTDIAAIYEEWRESTIRDFDVMREVELRKLNRVEKEAWAAWERSQNPAQAAVVSTDGSEQRTQKTVKEQIGDPRYLDQILKCITSRRALLGLDAPTRVAPTSPDGEEAYHSHVMTKLMELAEQADGGPVVVDSKFIENEVNRTLRDAKEDGEPAHDARPTSLAGA